MYGNTSPHAIYVHAASRLGTSSTASLPLSLFPLAHGRAYLAISSSISQSLMGTTRSSYSLTGSRRCVTLFLVIKRPRLQSSLGCFLIMLLDSTVFRNR